MSVSYLTVQQVLYIHDRIIQETGGGHGVVNVGLLRSAVERPQSGFGARESFPTIFLKAAALIDALVRYHPFVDGNKRTGFVAAGIFLELNGYQLTIARSDAVDFVVNIALQQPHIREIANMIEAHVAKLPTSDS